MDPPASGPSRAVVTPQEQRAIDSKLQQVLRLPGNDCCADCGARHPRWASVNLGVVICLECSGVHRKMGVHISKVKSVTLDRWTAQWVETLEAIGNDVARKYYEHALPQDFKRPSRSDDPQ
ncbi:arf1-directed GTPase-activating related protein [Cyclospora cayetanensis]|uniref:Arf1-directed GTPase-activating related protein n=1 Tax=Cyclospora cayetanensis TaxID=88456 RepID=A0A1D3D6A7_9EIME|nr:arf1-directed GTPase-activating related protein [Cyclospora cayetanensis]